MSALSSPTLIPARSGAHASLAAGQKINISSIYGGQVIDVWAFTHAKPPVHLSMKNTRNSIKKLIPQVGDTLVGSDRQSMLILREDSTDGAHDTILPACDAHRYRTELGVKGWHASCEENLHVEGVKAGLWGNGGLGFSPDQISLFRRVDVEGMAAGGMLKYGETTTKAGQYVAFEAQVACVVIMSACPMDLVPGNSLTDCEFEVFISPGEQC